MILAGLRAPASHDELSPIIYFLTSTIARKDGARRRGRLLEVTFDGKKMLSVSSKHRFAIVDVKEKQKFEKPMDTADIDVSVDRRA